MRTVFWTARELDSTSDVKVMYMALDLSAARWKVALTDGTGRNARIVTVPAYDYEGLKAQVHKALKAFKLVDVPVTVVSCYEAGREGFAVHRQLLACRFDNRVVTSNSIKVDQRARRAKTDRLDAEALVKQLVLHHANPKSRELREVTVPTIAQEDARQPVRELAELKREKTQVTNRIVSLLLTQGIRVALRTERDLDQLEYDLTHDLLSHAPELRARIERELARLDLVREQIGKLHQARKEALKAEKSDAMKQVATLMMLSGIGIESAWTLVFEVFNWRKFKDARAVGSFFGLSPTPYASGNSMKEQGISKAGASRLRSLMVELAWLWLRYQPDSELTEWFMRRFGQGKRVRRIGIVGVARRLAVALWRFHTTGELPKGAKTKSTTVKSTRTAVDRGAAKSRETVAEKVLASAA